MGNALAGDARVSAYKLRYETPHGHYSIDADRKGILSPLVRMFLVVVAHRIDHLFRREGWRD